MKKTVLTILLIIIAVLDMLALDDLTTNDQPSFFWEFTMLGISVFLIPAIVVLWRKA